MKFEPMTPEDQDRIYKDGVLVLHTIPTYIPPIVRTKLSHYFTPETYPKGCYL